jgi:hypothetical protein
MEKLHKNIKTLFKPGYFIDPLRELMFPNIGQLYDRLQLSRVYNSFETLREKKESIIIKAKKAFQLKGNLNYRVPVVNECQFHILLMINPIESSRVILHSSVFIVRLYGYDSFSDINQTLPLLTTISNPCSSPIAAKLWL